MSKKYHINKNNEVAVCNASKKSCPLGPHFENRELAEKYNDSKNEFISKIMSGELLDKHKHTQKYFNMSDEEYNEQVGYMGKPLEDLVEDVNASLGKRTLSKSEVNELKCLRFDINRCSDILPTRFILKDNIPKDVEDDLKAAFQRAFPGTKRKFPALAVVETSQGFHIWTDDNAFLDAIYISKDSRAQNRSAEYKDLTTGAQIHQSKLNQDRDGKLSVKEEDKFVTDKMRAEIAEYDPLESWNEDKVFNLTDQEAAEVFVASHMQMNCSKLVYTKKNGENDIVWFDKDIKTNAKRILDKGLQIAYTIRNNNIGNSRNVTEEDIEYFNKNYGQFFKDGKVPTDGKFTPNDLKRDCVKFKPSKSHNDKAFGVGDNTIPEDERSTEVLRFGEFGIKKQNFQYWDVLDIRDFKRMNPVITGTIKEIGEEL